MTSVVGQLGHESAVAQTVSSKGPTISWVLTRGDGPARLRTQQQVAFGPDRAVDGAVVVGQDGHQSVEGVGAALTESSAVLLDRLPPTQRAAALQRLFHLSRGAGISVVRVPLGASDFALSDYTYDDLPVGATDPDLEHFDISRDERHVIPILREARAINPDLRVVLTPWSAPAWMKTSGTTHGGSLDPDLEPVYAQYLLRAVAAYSAAGITVRAVTLANEPGHSTAGYPSMWMDRPQQERLALLLRTRLDDAGLGSVGILAHDHNWDQTADPIAALTGQAAPAFAGAAFHCYAGDVSAQSLVHDAAPQASLWTTECSGGDWSHSFSGDLRWGARHMLIGAFRNHSVATMWWNLALDPSGGPTNGGCQGCRGVLTVDPATSTVTPNVEFWLLAHMGRFVPRGSTRLTSSPRTSTEIESVAFRTPSGRHVLLLLNDSAVKRAVTVRWSGRSAQLSLPAGAVATATW